MLFLILFGIFYSFEDAYKFAKKEAEKVFLTIDQSDNMIIKHKDKIEIDEYGYWEIKENNHGYL